ncbi:hypothetical protein FOZ62_016002 [Perkinsus olseni]|uniref:Uncharacterized protein n=1 Tax=Perkinsus olseni TaxID=32597 RepID=A0A7J6S9K9_PEROL|nr:hypothetical protein FOZ62_016002 [Perkinsus olseni]
MLSMRATAQQRITTSEWHTSTMPTEQSRSTIKMKSLLVLTILSIVSVAIVNKNDDYDKTNDMEEFNAHVVQDNAMRNSYQSGDDSVDSGYTAERLLFPYVNQLKRWSHYTKS